jgi:hypothetical protein
MNNMSGRLSRHQTYDALTDMVLALHDDPALSEWFEKLAGLSSVQRRNEVYRMRLQLLDSDPEAPEDVVVPMLLLADDRIFQAARQAFRLL